MIPEFKRYWVLIDHGKRWIGSGLRHVEVRSIGPKWVRIRTLSKLQWHKIPRWQWDAMPHVENTGEPTTLAHIAEALRTWKKEGKMK